MTLLRASVGFVLFLIAFWLKDVDASTAWFGAASGPPRRGRSSATPPHRASRPAQRGDDR